MTKRLVFFLAFALWVALASLPRSAAGPEGAGLRSLLPSGAGVAQRVTPSSEEVTVAGSLDPAAPGVVVAIAPGKDAYPGVNIKPDGAAWDLSAFGHVEARLINTGSQPLSVALRVDNAGDWHDSPWDTESVTLSPGQSGTVTTIFGYAYGHKPGYALRSSAVVNLVLFAGKSDRSQSFRIESVAAGGVAGEAPTVAPEDVRVKPKNGLLLGPGGAADALPRVTVQAGTLTFSPPTGRWDLRDFLEVRVRVRNAGRVAVTPRVRLDSSGGSSEWIAGAALAAGRAEEIVVPFAGTAPVDLSQKDPPARIASDAVSAVVVDPQKETGSLTFPDRLDLSVLRVESIRADVPPPAPPPAWLGKRPPAAGDWIKTLDDEFTGAAVNPSVWSIAGDNYWDTQTHWSKADVLVGGGQVRLRYEKKTGFANDDPAQKQTPYAAGYLHTYDKWTQRYGYFEARMKLPTAPGLWPAFWMMPDRGRAAGPEQWKRQDTADGGMEFDVMEHLTRWGPYRYNIAMHYDGYGKDHKCVGLDRIYVQPDKAGYITCGLLWTPGEAVYYCNGREVLRWQNPRVSDVPEILMFTLPMGGWDNSPLDDARLPDTFTLDYVRVWDHLPGKRPA